MSNQLEESLDDLIKKEFYQLLRLYERTDDIQALFNIIDPNKLIELVQNASTKISKIGLNIIKQNYNSCYSDLNDYSRQQLLPSVDLANSLTSHVLSDMKPIAMTIKNYEDRYINLIEFLNKAKSDSDSNSFGGGVIGGIVSGLAFGPIGAIIGGIAAGSYVEGRTREDAQAEFRIKFESLTNEFCETMNDIEIYIDEMVDRLIGATEQYLQSLVNQCQLR